MNATTFAQLQLAEPIQKAVEAEKYTTPTPIQAQAIPHLLAGRDLLGTAQTGTGKTAAFALPILHRLETHRRAAVPGAPRALVLSPTRELAAQIGQSLETYGRFLRFRHAVIFGGVNQNAQVRTLNRGVHVVVATPGRLLDLMNQGSVKLDRLEMFVLDEADRMLDMGFQPDLKRIIRALPANRQSLFFSATLSPEITELASGMLQDPVRVNVSPRTLTVERIEQRVLYVQQADKQTLLHDLLEATAPRRALVFTRTKSAADRVARKLSAAGFRADAIHGNKTQAARTYVLNRFRGGQVHILVATDVASRGIDVDGVTHVINFDMPNEPENYVHRIGRTGRAGARGIALSFCDSSERPSLRAIERLIRSQIEVDADHPYHIEQAPSRKPQPDGNRQDRNRRRFTGGRRRPGRQAAAR